MEITLEEVIAFVKLIEDKIDLLHVSRGMHAIQNLAPFINQPIYFQHGMNIEDTAKIKSAVNVPVTVVGSVTLEQAEEAIASGKIDMVSMARGLMADPEMIHHAKFNESEFTRPCVRCNNCIQRTHYLLAAIRCTVNATLGMETLYQQMDEPKKRKKVAVIGGGPGGMEAARTASKRGHQVVLFEKEKQLGGVLNMAAGPVFKQDIKKSNGVPSQYPIRKRASVVLGSSVIVMVFNVVTSFAFTVTLPVYTSSSPLYTVSV